MGRWAAVISLRTETLDGGFSLQQKVSHWPERANLRSAFCGSESRPSNPSKANGQGRKHAIALINAVAMQVRAGVNVTEWNLFVLLLILHTFMESGLSAAPAL